MDCFQTVLHIFCQLTKNLIIFAVSCAIYLGSYLLLCHFMTQGCEESAQMFHLLTLVHSSACKF